MFSGILWLFLRQRQPPRSNATDPLFPSTPFCRSIRAGAGLSAAQAQVVQARASRAESQAALSRLREVARLSGGKVPAKTEMEAAVAAEARARANVDSA